MTTLTTLFYTCNNILQQRVKITTLRRYNEFVRCFCWSYNHVEFLFSKETFWILQKKNEIIQKELKNLPIKSFCDRTSTNVSSWEIIVNKQRKVRNNERKSFCGLHFKKIVVEDKKIDKESWMRRVIHLSTWVFSHQIFLLNV